MNKRRTWSLALAAAAFISAAFMLALSPVHVAIRTTHPLSIAYIETLTAPFPARVLARNPAGDAALVETSMVARLLLERRASDSADMTLLIQLGGRSDTLIRGMDVSDSSPAALDALAGAIRATGVSAADLIRIDDAPSVFDLLSAALNTSHASLRDLFRIDCEIESVEFLRGRGNQLVLTLRSSEGVPGRLYIYRRADAFDMHLKMGALDFDVTPIGDGVYLRVKREFQAFPAEGNSNDFLQDSLPHDLNATKPAAGADYQAPDNSTPATLTLAIGFTHAGSRAYVAQMRPQRAGDAQEAEVVDELIRRQIAEDNLSVFGKGAAADSFAIDRVVQHLEHPDNITAPSSLSMLCSSGHAESSRGARELYASMLEDAADVGVLVVDRLCVDKSGLIDERIECSGPSAALSCNALPQQREVCGLAAGIGPNIDRAFAVVEARCLANNTLHHELGHILGAQHANGTSDPSAPTARAKIETDEALAETWITLVGSFDDCRKFRSESADRRKCHREVVYSDPDRTIVSAAVAGPPIAHPAGSPERNNAAQVRRALPIVARFGEQRSMRRCAQFARTFEVSFPFNSPRLQDLSNEAPDGKKTQFGQIRLAAGQAASFLRLCSYAAIRVIGHTDDVPGPDPTYNDRLSHARAELVRNAIGNELEASHRSRLCPPEGVGSRDPAMRGFSTVARSLNRRAVIQLSPAGCQQQSIQVSENIGR